MAFFLPILVATLAAASPMSQFITKQALASVPEGWALQGAAPADQQLNLHIRVKEENLDQLQKRLLEISDPDHKDYGKHMTKDEVDALTAPTKDTVDSVTKWLASHGIQAGELSSGMLSVSVSVNQAKQMLDADYGVYTHADTGREIVRATSYSLPQAVHGAIEMVQPTTLFSDFGASKKMLAVKKKGQTSLQARQGDICSNEGSSTSCLRQDYNINGYTPTKGKTTLGICGFLGEFPSEDDLSSYLRKYDPDVPSNTTFSYQQINDGPGSAGGQGEADLDAQIAVALVYPIETIFYSTGGSPPHGPGGEQNEPYLEWLNYTLALKTPSQTYSISYGDDETTVPTDYAKTVCDLFMKLGARGVSVLAAAGDSGAGGRSACQNGQIKKFQPSFPASCPWVTTVGGTYRYGDSESGFADGGSGFSDFFGQPDYQKTVVDAYVATLSKTVTGAFNASGRAYPDIAASYEPYPIFQGGFEGQSGGTSASTPATASIIALLNDYLVANGKQPLGFLNPWLYKKGYQGVRDIAKGASNVCGSKTAFPAKKGWDASTGFGVPDFAKLKELV
ncbi:hypothetical protein NLG97_g4642 [Lecanicillium saksenae]|uniref:Uncharacterized protein n=1 Tax=Lecanicillium saksenae TaxID=468837 RepID=A0ACC1QUW4_9HYPO|nr:hypothetical protein NLG97_g4642 [Lecanicillium saksenae]